MQSQNKKTMKTNWSKILTIILVITWLSVGVSMVTIFCYRITKSSLEKMQPKKEKKFLTLFKSESDELAKMRQPVRDVAIYFLSNRDTWEVRHGRFGCGEFAVWITGGENYVKIHSPQGYELKENEKEFFYNLYQEYLNDTLRFYKYEDYVDIEIIDNTKKFPIWKRIEE